MVGITSGGSGATGRQGGFWLARFASERTRLARLGRAFDELCIDLRGKRILGTTPTLSAAHATSFDVIVSSLSCEGLPDAPTLFSTLKDRLEPGGVLCVFVRAPEARGSDLVREDVVWTVAGSIAHAGFDVLFAEGSDHVRDVGMRRTDLARLPAALLQVAGRAFRTALELFIPRRFRENVAELLHRTNVCPRQALVVARRSFA